MRCGLSAWLVEAPLAGWLQSSRSPCGSGIPFSPPRLFVVSRRRDHLATSAALGLGFVVVRGRGLDHLGLAVVRGRGLDHLARSRTMVRGHGLDHLAPGAALGLDAARSTCDL